MKKQWDKWKIITFKVGDPEKNPSLKQVATLLKFKMVSELLRILVEFAKTRVGQDALRDFISKEKK